MFAAIVVACGDDGGAQQFPDANGNDDAAIPDAPPATGSANITAYVRANEEVAPETPLVGVIVVAQGRDGSVTGTATTDAAGKAAVEVQDNGTVHVVYPTTADGSSHVTTYVGVKPGDNLSTGAKYFDLPVMVTPQAGERQFTFPAVAGALSYAVVTPCYREYYIDSLSFNINLADYGCPASGPLAIVAYADRYGYGYGRILASLYIADQAYTPGSTALTAAQWVAQTDPNFTVSVTGVHPSTYGDLESVADYGGGHTIYTSDRTFAESGTITTALHTPATAPRSSSGAYLWRSGFGGNQTYWGRSATPATFDGSKLPWLSGVQFDSGTFSLLKTAGTYDAGVIQAEWSRSNGKGDDDFSWTILFPSDVTTVTVGTIPSQLAPYLPTSTDAVDVDVDLIDLASTDSYDAVRALPEWRFATAYDAIIGADETSAGISSYSNNGGGSGSGSGKGF